MVQGTVALISLIFFFKQKTAYEIYQCDWSSDVCSSDLVRVNLIKELLQQLIFGPVSPSREKSTGLLFNLYESSNFLELKRITETKVTFKWSWNLQ